ncbi:MAG: hypothetical protein ACI9FN_003460 [Saprospiraceae bacterium]|jgi:hypothetical protein
MYNECLLSLVVVGLLSCPSNLLYAFQNNGLEICDNLIDDDNDGDIDLNDKD